MSAWNIEKVAELDTYQEYNFNPMSEFNNNCSSCFACDGCGFNCCPTGDCPNGNQDTAWCHGNDYQWFRNNQIQICNDCQQKIEVILEQKKIKETLRRMNKNLESLGSARNIKLELVQEIIAKGLEKYQKHYEKRKN